MLKIVNIGKTFGSQTALENVDLEVRDGEFFALLGPSGCGKTTLLRIIAGFENPTSGQIFWNRTRIDTLPPQERPFNMVFQKYALFPHMTVLANILFGLSLLGRSTEPETRLDKAQMLKEAEQALRLVGLWDFRDRLPETLSGGQAQRVAIARAIVKKPKILLLDEPLSALDQKMREHMQTELRELQRRVGITFIFVTHDQEEAFALSDRVAVMNKGRLEQVSSPEDLYGKPETSFVARFIGSSGAIRGELKGRELQLAGGQSLRGQLRDSQSGAGIAVVRPENIYIQLAGEKTADRPSHLINSTHEINRLTGHVHAAVFRGAHRELQVDVDASCRLRVFMNDASKFARLPKGAPVNLEFSAADTFLYADETLS